MRNTTESLGVSAAVAFAALLAGADAAHADAAAAGVGGGVRAKVELAAKPSDAAAASPETAVPPPDEECDKEKPSRREAHPIEIGFAITQNEPVGGKSDSGNAGFEASANVSVVRKEGLRRFALGLRVRLAKIFEVINGVDGAPLEVDAPTRVVAGDVAWKPRVSSKGVVVDLDLHAGPGFGHVEDRTLAPGVVVEDADRLVGLVSGGVQVGGQNLRLQVGGDCVLAKQEALQTCGARIGVVAEF